MTESVQKPIIILGTHRSGTTFLGGVLSHHPDVAFWEEPRHVWVYGNTYKPDDILTAEDAHPKVVSHIRKEFAKFLRKSGKARFTEKTPSNCLRIGFIREVFPDALFVHIYRDGRAVVRSTRQVNTGTPDAKWIFKRLFGMPIWEWPSLVPRAIRTFGARFSGEKMSFWGPMPPGWREWLENDTQLVMLAKQWRYTIEPILDARDSFQASQWLDLSYESFMFEPEQSIVRIMDFAGLKHSEEVIEHVRETIDPGRKDKWRDELTEEELRDLEPILRGTVERMGYEW